MKRLVLLLSLVSLAFISCKPAIHGSGKLEVKKFPLQGFSAVHISNRFRANLQMGTEYKVTVTIDDNMEKHLKAQTSGKVLEIGMDSSHQYEPSDGGMVVDIQAPSLDELQVTGAAMATMKGFSSKKFTITLTGATKLSGDITTDVLVMEATGASIIQLSGKAQQMKVELTGASKARLLALKTEKAQIDLTGACSAQVNVSESLSLDASGASSLEYAGKPKLKSITTSGASSIKSVQTEDNLPEKSAD